MPILRKFAKLQKKKKKKLRWCVLLCNIGLQHPNLLKRNSTMNVFLGITETIFLWIFQNRYYMESLQIISKICLGPLAIFLNMAYIFMQVKRNTKHLFADVLQNRCSCKFRTFHRKIPVLESLFNKVAGLKTRNFIKKKLQHRRFPVKFVEFLRTPIFTEHLPWLLLEMERHFIIFPFFITMI